MLSAGQPTECSTEPGLCLAGSMRHTWVRGRGRVRVRVRGRGRGRGRISVSVGMGRSCRTLNPHKVAMA